MSTTVSAHRPPAIQVLVGVRLPLIVALHQRALLMQPSLLAWVVPFAHYDPR
jgi:hypothetical protein